VTVTNVWQSLSIFTVVVYDKPNLQGVDYQDKKAEIAESGLSE